MWAFIHKLGSPKWFYRISARLQPWFWALAVLLLLAGSVWGLVFAPADYQQGNSFRIIYVHVPAAILAQSCFVTMAVAGVIFLVWKIKIADMAASVIAPFGAAMTFVALFSGAVWGMPTWGTWWVWDARLTSMLILAFLYAGVMALFAAFEHTSNRGKAAAILSIVGAVNLPIIKYSVEWWNTLHQGATFTLTEAPKMSADMWMPLLLMMIGSYLLVAALAIYRTNTLILSRDQAKAWVKEYVRAQHK